MKQNVWILNHYASDTFFDEGGRHYWFAQYLKEKKYNPVIFSANSIHGRGDYYFPTASLYEIKIAKKINVPYVFVKARKYEGNGKTRVLNMIDYYKNVIASTKKYSKKTRIKPDIIVASSVHPLTLIAGIKLAKYFNVKCICEVRDLWPESLVAYGILKKESVLAKILYHGELCIYKKADKVIMTWPGGYDYILDRGWEKAIPEEKVVHISNGVDISSFEENIKKYRYEKIFEYNCKIFTYAGSVRRVNNIRLLVEAAEILSINDCKAKILVFGDGDERKELEQYVKARSIENIEFMGRVDKKYIPFILKNSYATILHNSSTSLDKYGQSQNKLFEYLAAGKPILMTYSVGHSVVKNCGCGIELDEQNAINIANAIMKMVNCDQNQYLQICDNVTHASQKYDFKNLTNVLIEQIEK